ncbi:MAG: type II secretion system protein GspK [Candidatus Omnitrophica bacterium]|nr:type II secretion system protein GspK [Candidatus Omnitrophota bacterium]MDD5477068.1 type II secretion system protein GspK [Candidatus Omnitrophota bacterium]
MQTKGGSILFISLWTVCLLTIFSVVLGYQVRQKLTLAQRLDEKSKLHFIAQAAVMKAIVELKKEEEKPYDALGDTWSNNLGAFKGMAIGDGEVDISYGYIDEKSGICQTRYGLVDEERKININKAGMPVLKHLFQIVAGLDETGAQELAACIIDWRDSDSQLSIPLGSAENFDYRSMQYPYEARNQDFEVLDEILLVKGMNKDIFEKIKDYVTIYSSGRVNINTASRPVLLALGLDDNIAGDIMSFRAGEDGVMATADDKIFDTTANIIPKLSQSYHLSVSELAELSAVVDQYLVANSKNFMIKASAKLNNRVDTVELICVINRNGNILYWRES